MAWAYLFLAAALEIVMGLSLKLNAGWTRLGPSLVAAIAGLGSIYLLALALRSLPVGMAYAIWTGIGTIRLVLAGVLVFQEEMNWLRALFLGLTFIGILGLRFSEATT
ncbi:DMT family transporter [Pandoraea apista]|uniref:Guanidinium exporter n=1 Tax=Pandoraea apista TaxID=93218 RepID=A0ABX9ZNJ0_9BURK|nr:multidrug efflux SMR transporter [Pandoraea apista]PTD99438.1 QacE family quaternary ammonium compound efflux SMR transporter [Pandoraea apista]RRJ29702.1 multidrug efflux SMR transporter [Pandoraea apista]RRJ79655.1 multidrug efflux SMR transporter [Pandoraea apista]RSD06368.1 multidrug efflux SMR transporter [Pandoraea apista]RSD11402.1 multidrug efflux SMR transporter [Pandoraea apista]